MLVAECCEVGQAILGALAIYALRKRGPAQGQISKIKIEKVNLLFK